MRRWSWLAVILLLFGCSDPIEGSVVGKRTYGYTYDCGYSVPAGNNISVHIYMECEAQAWELKIQPGGGKKAEWRRVNLGPWLRTNEGDVIKVG